MLKYRLIALLLILSVSLLGVISPGCGSDIEEPQSYGPSQVDFPVDEGAHPDLAVEWWYLNSHLVDSSGREYTAMIAYFRPSLRIISISDLEAETFHHEVPYYWEIEEATPDYAEGKLDLRWDGSDRWHRTDPGSLSYHLEASGSDIGLSLDLVSEKQPLTVGGDGLIEWTEGSTYYYSLTSLQVEGEIAFDGEELEVEGIGWMDHQWMDSMSRRGWNWFSVQLDNDTEIILWEISNPAGVVLSRDLTMMLPDESIYHTVDLELEMLDSWVSPETGEEYGVRWRVRDETRNLDLEIGALYPEQEILIFPENPQIGWEFWEGGTTVSGELDGETVSGVGYAELVPAGW